MIGPQAVLGRTLGFLRFAPSVDIGFGDDMTSYLAQRGVRLFTFSPPGSRPVYMLVAGRQSRYLIPKMAAATRRLV